MKTRDMQIAEAVRDAFEKSAYCGAYMDDEQLKEIIAGIPVEDEPYCWIVSGCGTPFYGEYAEHDARVEAQRVGGTATAFPLHTRPQSAKSARRQTLEECAALLDEVGATLQRVDKSDDYWIGVGAMTVAGENAIRALLDKPAAEQAPAQLTDEECFELYNKPVEFRFYNDKGEEVLDFASKDKLRGEK